MNKRNENTDHKADASKQETTYIPMNSKTSNTADAALFAQEHEYFLHTIDDQGNTQILTTLNDFQMGGSADFSDDKNPKNASHQTMVIAEEITLTGVFKTNNLTLAGIVTSQKDAVLDVSGSPWPDIPATPKGNGGTAFPGNPGGSIQFFSSQLMFPLPTFNARGGEGQNGQNAPSGVGGDSGNGGNGGPITCWVFSPYEAAVNAIKRALSNLSKASLDNLSKKLQKAFPSKELQSQFLKIENIAMDLFPGGPNQSTKFNRKVLGKMVTLLDQLSNTFSVYSTGLITDLREKSENLPGSPGTPGTGSAGNGLAGQYGSDPQKGKLNLNVFDQTPIPNQLGFSKVTTDTFNKAFLLQTKMALQKAKMSYLQADVVKNPDALTTTAILLQRLKKRLDFVPKSTNSSKEVKLYQPIYNEVNAYLRQFSKGQDYYGYGYNNVPLVSLQEYMKDLNQLIQDFNGISGAYSTYYAALQNQKKTRANVKIMKASASSTKTIANEKVSILEHKMELTAQSIAQYKTPIKEKKAFLDTVLDQVKADIMDYYNAPDGFTIFNDVISALSMTAFSPTNFMKAIQGAGTVAKIINSFTKTGATIPNDQGQQVNRTYLIDEVSTVENGVNGLHESYKELYGGKLAPSDPGASKILMEESQIETILGSFKQTLPDDITAVKKAFGDYIKTITERNALIIKYNALLDVLVKNLSEIKTAEQAINTANKISNNILNPGLPEVVHAVGSIFHQTRDQILYKAYEASRALQFWSLSNTNFFAETMGFNAGGLTPSDLTFKYIKSSLTNQWLNALSNFSTNPTPFPNPGDEQGAIINFNDPAILETLRKENAVMVRIPAISKGMELSPDWENNMLHDAANIRLTDVHVWLDGAKVIKNGTSVNDMIQVIIVHQGHETLVSPENNSYQFSHESITKIFEYRSISKKVTIQANFGDLDINHPNQGNNFALIGPFTSWLIQVEGTASVTSVNLIKAVKNGQVEKGSIIQVDAVKYTVYSIKKEGDKTIINVTLFGMHKEYIIINNQVVDKNGKIAETAIAFSKPDPNAKYVDLSGVTGIRMEFRGTFYPFKNS